jgi:4-diphosphocytidyl-2-C-methyl-D-erythritol kinase
MQKLAPAKVNLFLKVISKNAEGYHKILSVFQTISLYDKIKVSLIPEDKIIVSSNLKVIEGEKNLCYKVAELLKKKYKIKNGLKIYIEKNIPLGSGLGGASSDAACLLEMLVKIFNLNVEKDELVKLCSQIGKDVPYFLYKGLCLVEGMGEKITNISSYPWKKNPLWFILVYPNKVLSTKRVYEVYDRICVREEEIRVTKKKILDFIKQKDIKSLLYNSLEVPAFEIAPILKKIKNLMFKLGIKNVSMSGSGSTIFGVFFKKNEALEFKDKIEKAIKNCSIFLAKSV